VFALSGRGLCDGPIPRPEESYRLWCVLECDQVKTQKPSAPTVNKQVEEGRTKKERKLCRLSEGISWIHVRIHSGVPHTKGNTSIVPKLFFFGFEYNDDH
jgi:hypothetical protein